MNSKKYTKILFISITVCIFSATFSVLAGSVNIFGAPNQQSMMNILCYSRIPRMLASLFAGAALAVSGGILQSVLSNKLASPSIIGVNAGAGLGVTLCCAFGVLSGWCVSVFAFVGSLIAIIVISIFGSRTRASKTTVILGGVALNAILNALSESICALIPETSMLTTEFKIGGFSAVSYPRILPAIALIIIALIIVFILFNELDVLALGDETAKSIGLNTKKYRIIFLILCAMLAGAAVSFTGLIGFVGLIVPHFVKRLTTNESRKIIPLCAIIGGAFVCFCDTLSRLIFAPFEMPVGILMAIIGGPVFVAIVINSKGGHNAKN